MSSFLIKCTTEIQYRREGGGGDRRGNYPGTQSIKYIIYYYNYHKLTAGTQQNLGKLTIVGKLSGPGLVLVIIFCQN